MSKKVALPLIFVALLIGLAVGRFLPAHHYEPWKNSHLLYDTTTGQICDPLKLYQQKAAQNRNQNPIDNAFEDLALRGSPDTYVPPCK